LLIQVQKSLKYSTCFKTNQLKRIGTLELTSITTTLSTFQIVKNIITMSLALLWFIKEQQFHTYNRNKNYVDLFIKLIYLELYYNKIYYSYPSYD